MPREIKIFLLYHLIGATLLYLMYFILKRRGRRLTGIKLIGGLYAFVNLGVLAALLLTRTYAWNYLSLMVSLALLLAAFVLFLVKLAKNSGIR